MPPGSPSPSAFPRWNQAGVSYWRQNGEMVICEWRPFIVINRRVSASSCSPSPSPRRHRGPWIFHCDSAEARSLSFSQIFPLAPTPENVWFKECGTYLLSVSRLLWHNHKLTQNKGMKLEVGDTFGPSLYLYLLLLRDFQILISLTINKELGLLPYLAIQRLVGSLNPDVSPVPLPSSSSFIFSGERELLGPEIINLGSDKSRMLSRNNGNNHQGKVRVAFLPWMWT